MEQSNHSGKTIVTALYAFKAQNTDEVRKSRLDKKRTTTCFVCFFVVSSLNIAIVF